MTPLSFSSEPPRENSAEKSEKKEIDDHGAERGRVVADRFACLGLERAQRRQSDQVHEELNATMVHRDV